MVINVPPTLIITNCIFLQSTFIHFEYLSELAVLINLNNVNLLTASVV
jgi:hypothetical protein